MKISFDIKLTAKDLFEKGVNPKEVARILNVRQDTVRHWNQRYEKGTFCVEDTRKQAYLKKLEEYKKIRSKYLLYEDF